MFTDITATFLKSDIEDNRTASVFSYIPFLFFLTLILTRRSPYAKFNANQGCVLSIVVLISSVISFVIDGGFFVSILLWPLKAVFSLIHFAALASMIYCIYIVIKERAVEVPFVSGIKIFK